MREPYLYTFKAGGAIQIKDGDTSLATAVDETSAEVLSDALWLAYRLVSTFPGLLDGESDVNGSDLVEQVTRDLRHFKCLREYLNRD